MSLEFPLGLLIGLTALWVYHRVRLGSYQNMAQTIVERGELEAESIRKNGELAVKEKKLEMQRDLENERQKEKQKLEKEGLRMKEREDKLEDRIHHADKKLSEIEKREAALMKKSDDLEKRKTELQIKEVKLLTELERVSGLTQSEAKEHLLSQLSNEVKADGANFIRKVTKETEEESERKATQIICTAINRLASSTVSENTVNTVPLPSDEMKGRIIGREGRNIRTLEQETGINFVIDDTPGAVVLSGFDPVRLFVAKTALTELIKDGRIHPTRIEEAVEKARASVKNKIKQAGEDAALRVNQYDLHPELITLLGKLKFRYSFGQNVLEHSIEVSHILGLMATELHLDVNRAKRIGLLHDIGKAVTHEIEGTHAVVGHDFALKFGESKEVANGIGCHHGEMDPTTIEGSLCGAADAISASRPGARIEAIEEYTKRLRNLENIAYEFPGVEKAYALQAGREIRIAVLPDMIDDDGTINLARDLTKRIEQELRYPGKIKITVVREKKVVEYAI